MNRKLIAGFFFLALISVSASKSVTTRFSNKRSFTKGPVGTVYMIVDKSDYELHVYDDVGWFATYPVVFGNKLLGDKMMEGDRKTPEGTFRITAKRPHNKWNKIMMIDYPTKESWEKFNRRKAQGIIPRSARIGGAIGIHGTWPNESYVVDAYNNWTQGCVSLRNGDMNELFEYIGVGTKIMIRR